MFNWKTNSDRKILEAIPAAVYMIDADRRIRFWSRGAQEMTGCTSESLTGELYSTRAMNYVDSEGETLQVHQYPAMQCLKKGEPVSGNFLLYSCSNGKLVVEESCAPLYEKGRITGVVGIIKNLDRCSDTIRQELRDEKKDRLITICGWCKMIRVADKSWSNLEHYLTEDGFGVFTHSMCPSCAEKIFEKKVYLESYQNLCQSISSGITVDEVLKLIVSNVVNVMNVKASSLRLLSRDKQSLELAAYHGLSEKYANKGPVAYDASVDDAEAGKPVSLYDITEHTDSRYYKEAIEEGIRSILSIPLRYENSTIGVLRMYTSEPVKYTDEDMKFMSAIANQAAIAINNADHFEKAVSKEKEYLRVFEDITKTVSSSLNVEEVLQMIVRKMPEVLGLKAASLRLINKEEKQLELAAFWGLSDRYANKGPVAYDFSIQDA
ncbi:GAF domain-containing protein, partial [bacterium]|nr:GAF domain-containing protein [bacterium]